jgi:SnoaL-like domain
MASHDPAAVVAAELEISRVLKRYCRSMDRIDAPLGYTVWHEDGVADYGHLFQGTGRGFIDWVCDYHRTLDAQSHQIANTLIDVRGDRAVSESYVTVALLFTEDGQSRLTTGRGRYLDTWSCRGGRWAIDARYYVHDFSETRGVDARPGWGRRDEQDPSYALLGALGSA